MAQKDYPLQNAQIDALQSLKIFNKEFSENLPFIMVVSKDTIQFMAFKGIDSGQVKSKMIGLKDQNVTCHLESPDVLYIGTEQGKLYLINKEFGVICVI